MITKEILNDVCEFSGDKLVRHSMKNQVLTCCPNESCVRYAKPLTQKDEIDLQKAIDEFIPDRNLEAEIDFILAEMTDMKIGFWERFKGKFRL